MSPYITLPETSIAPENQWLEDEFTFRMAYFHRLYYHGNLKVPQEIRPY